MNKHGSWALLWSKRILAWSKHLDRAVARESVLGRLLRWHGAEWLRGERANYVSSDSRDYTNVRNSVFAGRTGTRAVSTRPQVRWDDGLELAIAVREQDRRQRNSSHSLSMYSVFARAVSYVRANVA